MKFDYCYEFVTYRRFGNLLVAVDRSVRDTGILLASVSLPQSSIGFGGAEPTQQQEKDDGKCRTIQDRADR